VGLTPPSENGRRSSRCIYKTPPSRPRASYIAGLLYLVCPARAAPLLRPSSDLALLPPLHRPHAQHLPHYTIAMRPPTKQRCYTNLVPGEGLPRLSRQQKLPRVFFFFSPSLSCLVLYAPTRHWLGERSPLGRAAALLAGGWPPPSHATSTMDLQVAHGTCVCLLAGFARRSRPYAQAMAALRAFGQRRATDLSGSMVSAATLVSFQSSPSN
jgi:hypothetical protein